jgi:hypothetical protein
MQKEGPEKAAMYMLPLIESTFELLGVKRTETGFVSSQGTKFGTDKVEDFFNELFSGKAFSKDASTGGMTYTGKAFEGLNMDFSEVLQEEDFRTRLTRNYQQRFGKGGQINSGDFQAGLDLIFGPDPNSGALNKTNQGTLLNTFGTQPLNIAPRQIPQGRGGVPGSGSNQVPKGRTIIPNKGTSLAPKISVDKDTKDLMALLKDVQKNPIKVILEVSQTQTVSEQEFASKAVNALEKVLKERSGLIGMGV